MDAPVELQRIALELGSYIKDRQEQGDDPGAVIFVAVVIAYETLASAAGEEMAIRTILKWCGVEVSELNFIEDEGRKLH